MGFTRYWETKRNFSDEEFRALYKVFIEISIKFHGVVKLQVAFENGETGPQFRSFMILQTTTAHPYEGPGEPFIFCQKAGKGTCKTNLAPYDVIVRSFLRKAKAWFPDVIKHHFDGQEGVEEDKGVDPPIEKLLQEMVWYLSSEYGCGDLSYQIAQEYLKSKTGLRFPVKIHRGIHRRVPTFDEDFPDFMIKFVAKAKKEKLKEAQKEVSK